MVMNSYEWLKQPKYSGFIVVDPDGWDRTNYETSMKEEINEEEFLFRLYRSTTMVAPKH